MAESEQEVEETVARLVSVFGEGGICPTSAQWKQLLVSEHDGKIAMVNFMKFRERAAYPDGADASLSGGEAIARYAAVSQKKVSEVGGKFLFTAGVDFVLIGEQEEWDAIGIVEYPNRGAFLALFQDPEYIACHHHRVAGTERHRMVVAKL
jgi:uncharacterized protein (DUF1330 family)